MPVLVELEPFLPGLWVGRDRGSRPSRTRLPGRLGTVELAEIALGLAVGPASSGLEGTFPALARESPLRLSELADM
jgi:hypothetical protein